MPHPRSLSDDHGHRAEPGPVCEDTASPGIGNRRFHDEFGVGGFGEDENSHDHGDNNEENESYIDDHANASVAWGEMLYDRDCVRQCQWEGESSKENREWDANVSGNHKRLCEGGRSPVAEFPRRTTIARPLRPRSIDSYPCNREGSFEDDGGLRHRPIVTRTADLVERSLDRICFDQIQRPPSISAIFDKDEDCYYDADNENHQDDREAPVNEVFFEQDQFEAVAHRRNVQSFGRSSNEHGYQDEESSLGSGPSAIGHDDRQESAKPAAEIFHSSESLKVIQRIESVMQSLLDHLDKKEEPILRGYVNPESDDDCSDDCGDRTDAFIRVSKSNGDKKFCRSFGNISQSRSFASICLVMSFIHQLMLSNRTTTTREVYYVFVTHFRNQRECDEVILDVAKILGVPRRSLGLSASPKGWFCGCVQIARRGKLPSGKDVSGSIDGTALSSIQGLPITREWTERDGSGRTEDGVEIALSSRDARAVLVVEKEGVYNRLSEERIFDRFPCILVTGKGFPDLATRALVSTLHRELDLPVIGLCDCNPYGISVLSLYFDAGDRMGVDGRMRYSVPMQWIGLRPSKVARLKRDLPETVFQQLTDMDNKRITSLLGMGNSFLNEEDEDEIRSMEEAGYKVELEALYWLGPDYMGNWVVESLRGVCGASGGTGG